MTSEESLAKNIRDEFIHRLDMSQLEHRRVWVLIELASLGYDVIADDLICAASNILKSRGN